MKYEISNIEERWMNKLNESIDEFKQNTAHLSITHINLADTAKHFANATHANEAGKEAIIKAFQKLSFKSTNFTPPNIGEIKYSNLLFRNIDSGEIIEVEYEKFNKLKQETKDKLIPHQVIKGHIETYRTNNKDVNFIIDGQYYHYLKDISLPSTWHSIETPNGTMIKVQHDPIYDGQYNPTILHTYTGGVETTINPLNRTTSGNIY